MISISVICLCIYTHSFRSFALMYNTHSFEFSFYPPLSFFVLYKTYWLLFCILSFCFSCCPSSPLPFSLLLLLLASACARSISFFCFMLTLSFSLSFFFSPTTPPTTPETKLVYSVFSTSRLCAAVTVIFLSNICFFHLQISPPPSHFSCCH